MHEDPGLARHRVLLQNCDVCCLDFRADEVKLGLTGWTLGLFASLVRKIPMVFFEIIPLFSKAAPTIGTQLYFRSAPPLCNHHLAHFMLSQVDVNRELILTVWPTLHPASYFTRLKAVHRWALATYAISKLCSSTPWAAGLAQQPLETQVIWLGVYQLASTATQGTLLMLNEVSTQR